MQLTTHSCKHLSSKRWQKTADHVIMQLNFITKIQKIHDKKKNKTYKALTI